MKKVNKSKPWFWVFSLSWLCWLGFIFSNSLKSRSSSSAQSKPLENIIKPPLNAIGITKDTDRIAELIIRKAAHITEFFVLTLLFVLVLHFWGKKPLHCLIIGGAVSAFAACIDETLQIFANRGASFTDVLIDCIGVALAILLCLGVKAIRDRKKKAKAQK